MVSLGCPKNLVDAEIMLGFLDREGFEITTDEKDADIIIVRIAKMNLSVTRCASRYFL